MKRHVVLVNPSLVGNNGREVVLKGLADYPSNLGFLGSVLVRNGYTVQIHDSNIHPDWRERTLDSLRRGDCAYLGFTCMSSQCRSALEFSRLVRNEFPGTLIVFGGVHPTLLPESILRTALVDICVVGEGDVAALRIADYANRQVGLDDIPNIATIPRGGDVLRTRKAPPTPFDSLPPRLEECLFEQDLNRYVHTFRIGGTSYRRFPILTGLGCRYRCAFCINHITKRPYRSKRAAGILAEMRTLFHRYGINYFNLQDEHFFGDRARLPEFLSLLENDPDLAGAIRWDTTIRVSDIRPDYIDANALRRIKATGGDGFGVGGESGADSMLGKLRKGIRRRDILRAVEIANEADFHLAFSFVMLWPGETFPEMLETARLIDRLYAMSACVTVPFFQTYRPYPGSEWEKDLTPFEDPWNMPPTIWKFSNVDKEEIERSHGPDVYRLVSSTQMLCATAPSRHNRAAGLKGLASAAIDRLCSWRIRSGRLGACVEDPLYRFIRNRYFIAT